MMYAAVCNNIVHLAFFFILKSLTNDLFKCGASKKVFICTHTVVIIINIFLNLHTKRLVTPQTVIGLPPGAGLKHW